MRSIYKKEIKSYFSTLTGFAVIAFMLLFSGIFVSVYSLFSYASSVEVSYTNFLIVLIVAVPVLAMRAIAEERRSGTYILLNSLPIKPISYILAKYFAMLTVISIPIVITFLYAFILNFYGDVNFLSAISATFALILLAGALLAVGLFISSLFDNVVICAVVTVGAMLAIYYLPTLVLLIPASALSSFVILSVCSLLLSAAAAVASQNKNIGYGVFIALELLLLALLSFFPGFLAGFARSIFSAMSITDKFNSFASYGIFDISTVFYYVSTAVFFIFLTLRSVEGRYRK